MIAKCLVVIWLLVLCADAQVLDNKPSYCYSADAERPQLEMFGTTTEYDKVRNHKGIDHSVSKCKPSRFWYQGRHGSRYPSVADGDNLLPANTTINTDITRNYDLFKTTLCPSDAKLIKNWKINPNFTLSTSGALTESGWVELTNLAVRLQKAFPTLLPKNYTQGHYFFRHSPVPRTLTSAQAFANGLFGSNEYSKVNYTGGESPDLFLYPWSNCALWASSFVNVLDSQIFTQGSNYQQMVKDVSEKLGFHGAHQLNSTFVDKLITHCRYEQIYNHIAPSAFCSAFSVANQQVNEYLRDLQFSQLFGYGNLDYKKLYENMSCYLLQAMLKFLQSNDPSEQKAKIWFGHDVTLLFMYTSLGLFEDEVPFTDSNFAQQTHRKWKTSLLAPMAGNLAVIRFDCADGDNDILFLHNENPLQIPGCKSNGVCKQSLILERYRRFVNANCDSIFCTNSY